MTGGPPVRGDLLPYWQPDAPVSSADRAAWLLAARRIGIGLRELAHVRAEVDEELLTLAFACASMRSAIAYEGAIRSEKVAARIVEDGTGMAGVALPCRPGATDDEVKHVVLAVVKAAHTVDAVPVDAETLAQLQTVQLFEELVAAGFDRLRRIGGGVRRLAGGQAS